MYPRVQVLKRTDFPAHTFFGHLLRGTQFYQNRHLDRAAEEWGAADRLGYKKPIPLDRVDDRICCGGHIREVPFLFFLYAIFVNKAQGIGKIKANGILKSLIFDGGRLICAATNRPQERIGNFIIKKENISADRLEDFVQDAKQQGQRIGEYLVDRGLLSNHVLHEILSLQVKEILGDILSWQHGRFYFLEKSIHNEIIVNYDPIRVARSVTLKGFSLPEFCNKISDHKTVFRLSPYVEEKKTRILQSLSGYDQTILSLTDGARNIEQLIKFCGEDEHPVINSLYRLNAAGLIRQTREVVVYSDQLYNEMSRIMGALIDINAIIAGRLIDVLGVKAERLIQKSRQNINPLYQNIFADIPLHSPTKIAINSIFKNIARYYSAPGQSVFFIHAFCELFKNLLDELEKFLGTQMAAEISARTQAQMATIERFAQDSLLKNGLLEMLRHVIH